MSNKIYSFDVKKGAVELARQRGVVPEAISKALDITIGQLETWRLEVKCKDLKEEVEELEGYLEFTSKENNELKDQLMSIEEISNQFIY
jgi:transposase-like protein